MSTNKTFGISGEATCDLPYLSEGNYGVWAKDLLKNLT